MSKVSSVKKVVIVEGQSNAIGTILTDHLPLDLVGPRIGQTAYVDSWEILEAGVNNSGKDPSLTYPNRYGFEMRLLQLLYDHFNIDIALIKSGRGGIPLAPQPGSYNDWSSTSVDDFFTFAQALYVAAIAALNHPSQTIAKIWCQGENDAGAGRSESQYRDDQRANILTWRSDNNFSTAFIDLSLSSQQTAISSINKTRINDAKLSIAEFVYNSATKVMIRKSGTYVIPNTWFIIQDEPCNAFYENDDGSSGGADNIHYTPTGYDNIAHYIFEVITHPYFQIG
jgi:hypothetical protein